MNFNEYINNDKFPDLLARIVIDKKFLTEIIDNNYFWDNIVSIRKLYGEGNTLKLLKLIYYDDKNYIENSIYKLFEIKFSKDFYNSLFNFILIKNNENESYVNKLIENNFLNINNFNYDFSEFIYNKNNNLFKNNIDYILDHSLNLLDLKNLSKNDKELNNKLKNYINKNKDKIIYEILYDSIGIEKENIDKEKILDSIKIIIDELMDNEKEEYCNIEKLGDGCFSNAYLIGTKVLKMGIKRECFLMPNNKRFLKPLFRKEIKSEINKEVLLCMEITEKVDTKNITRDDLYKVYKELREEGYVWLDATEKNIGRLIRKNKIYFNDLNPTMDAINYETTCDEELEAGELVILDNDFIVKEDENIKFENLTIYDLELRYQEEKSKKI